jgi:hypothetical protein
MHIGLVWNFFINVAPGTVSGNPEVSWPHALKISFMPITKK